MTMLYSIAPTKAATLLILLIFIFRNAFGQAILLEEPFAGSDLSAWSIVDQGAKQTPSRWVVIDGVLNQRSNIGGFSGAWVRDQNPGTFLAYDDGGSWTDYRFDVTLRSDDDDDIGLMFRVMNDANYYRFSWNSQRSYRKLMKFSNGGFEVLQEDNVAYEPGRAYRVSVTLAGANISVAVDGSVVFTASDAALPSGTVALYSALNRGSFYDDVLVVDTSGSETLTQINGAAWDETAVRKVMHTFAYGGQANDAKITAWADMAPQDAIAQMLTLDPKNPLLSPPEVPDSFAGTDGTLYGLGNFWSSSDPQNTLRSGARSRFRVGSFAGAKETWLKAAVSRGLNPFRQKLGLWETNYHLAVNQAARVNVYHVIRYYDDIMQAHADVLPYQHVLSTAATSAAITRQYKHYANRFINGECRCNEDFAREFHQLFFGILGANDPDHEEVTIKNTAAALTDMRVINPQAANSVDGDDMAYGMQYHPQHGLVILGETIDGADAQERISELAELAIEHPESLTHLPVLIVAGLADDELTEAKKAELRGTWASMQPKNVLEFLRTYAISTQFHSPGRVKYFSSVDRHVLMWNLLALDNETHDLEVYRKQRSELGKEDVEIFEPHHNVFGGQTGLEAAVSSEIFRQNFNAMTANFFRFGIAKKTIDGVEWRKEWVDAVPQSPGGGYRVDDVAEWLWQRFFADGLKSFGALERAHVYALLAQGTDLGWQVDANDPERVYGSDDVASGTDIGDLVASHAQTLIPLADEDDSVREDANQRVNETVNFMLASPFAFAQEGR